MLNMLITGKLYFNSRPSARGDMSANLKEYTPIVFQFPPLREGRLGEYGRYKVDVTFQFPPLREGRQDATGQDTAALISIPAPPRGATCFFCTGKNRREFQFPPLREGRQIPFCHRCACRLFQFPPLREGRH